MPDFIKCFINIKHINNLNSVSNKTITIHFADDTHLNYVSKKLSIIESAMNYGFKKLGESLISNKLSRNSGKLELVIFRLKTNKKRKVDEITITINKSKFSPVQNMNCLGVVS